MVEVLDLFSVTHFPTADVTRFAEHLMATKSYSALIRFCSTFAHVQWDFKGMVQTMARAKDWASAELMIRTYEREEDGKGALSLAEPANMLCLVANTADCVA